MSKFDDISLAILDRMIEQRETQLHNAEVGNNLRLYVKLRSEIRGLRAGRTKQKKGVAPGVPAWIRARQCRIDARATAQRSHSRAQASGGHARRPALRDEGTVVDPYGARWDALTAYIRRLNEKFPREDLTSLAGLFSTEREFARHIRQIEDRLPARAAKANRSPRPRSRVGVRKAPTLARRKPAARKTARKSTRSRAAPAARKSASRKSAVRSKR